ncbi:MAG: DUF3311 domain-containing protein [Pseudonocardiaceae bacterium]
MSFTAPHRGTPPHAHPALRWSSWNLLLLVPLLMLVTPLYNSEEPRLFGFPSFYWLQFLFIPVGVLCVWVVYLKTGTSERNPESDLGNNADGGARR